MLTWGVPSSLSHDPRRRHGRTTTPTPEAVLTWGAPNSLSNDPTAAPRVFIRHPNVPPRLKEHRLEPHVDALVVEEEAEVRAAAMPLAGQTWPGGATLSLGETLTKT